MTDIEIQRVTDPVKENKKSANVGSYQVPWVEKYRPRNLSDVLGNEETIIRLRAIAKDGNMPNLILCGPPGTGKTTSVHALARELLGSSYKDAVLELNASDARGIDVSAMIPCIVSLVCSFCHNFCVCVMCLSYSSLCLSREWLHDLYCILFIIFVLVTYR